MSLAELRRIWGAYLSWPAVSQIWALTTLSSTWMRRVANSTTQMVDDDGKEVEAEDTRLAGSSEGKGGVEGAASLRGGARRSGGATPLRGGARRSGEAAPSCGGATGGERRRRRVEGEGLLMRSRRPRRLLL